MVLHPFPMAFSIFSHQEKGITYASTHFFRNFSVIRTRMDSKRAVIQQSVSFIMKAGGFTHISLLCEHLPGQDINGIIDFLLEV